VLATLGVLDAAYLSYAHVAGAAVCGQSSGCDAVLEYAARAGLDAALLESCLDSGQGEAMVEADVAEGRDLGIRSTPSLFLNGHPFSVVPTREQLESRVAELNAAHGARRESSNDTGR
jgi:protein-disulfide isomerase